MNLNQQQFTVQMIKKYWAFALLAIAIAFFVYKKIISPQNSLEIKIIQLKQGWGYEILNNKKVYIHQEIIPAIEGRKAFVNKADAEKVANLLLKKLQQKKGLPQITLEEIDSLQITK